MTGVTIFSIATCNTVTREGSAYVLIQNQLGQEQLTQTFSNVTANQCIILGLLLGMQQISRPCHVKLVTTTPIGVASAINGKGVNKDLCNSLINELTQKHCTYEFEVWAGKAPEVKKLFSL